MPKSGIPWKAVSAKMGDKRPVAEYMKHWSRLRLKVRYDTM